MPNPALNPLSANYQGPRLLTQAGRQAGAQALGAQNWNQLTQAGKAQARGLEDPAAVRAYQAGSGAKAIGSATNGKPTPGKPGAAPQAAAPAAGGGKPQAGAPGAQPTPAAAPAAAPPAAPQSFQDWLNTQFGAGNPFGMQGNYSDPNNPLYAGAKRNLDQALAGTRARYGASGLGNSSREALAEGNAMGDFGAQIAQLGEQSRQADANRALAATGQGENYNLAANAQKAGIGNILNQIGLSEQNLPMLAPFLQLAQTFFQGSNLGTTSGSSTTNPWTFA